MQIWQGQVLVIKVSIVRTHKSERDKFKAAHTTLTPSPDLYVFQLSSKYFPDVKMFFPVTIDTHGASCFVYAKNIHIKPLLCKYTLKSPAYYF